MNRSEQDGAVAVDSLVDFPALDAEATAVVVIDMVNYQLTRGKAMMAEVERNGVDVTYFLDRVQDTVVPNLQRLFRAARASGATVVHVRAAGYRPDCGDVTPCMQQAMQGWGAVEGSWATEVIAPFALEPGDISLTKTGSGGFSSSLDLRLRNMKVENVLYTGIATSACVLSTVFQGFDLGYRGYLVSDGTATMSPYLQQATEDIVGTYLGHVVDTATAITQLEQGVLVSATR